MAEKLSEAVEKVGYDILPEAKPEDFEVTTVAAVSEPFADAKVRNKAAREKFKKMIDAQTKQAKETLKLDDQLKDRQANGNGKLVESTEEPYNKFYAAMDDARWELHDSIVDTIKRKFEGEFIFDSSVYNKAAPQISNILGKAFEDIAKVYKKEFDKYSLTESTNNIKLSLDESLFEAIEEKKPITESKKLQEAETITDVREYKPWQGAVTTYEKIQEAGKLEDFYGLLDEVYPAGIDVQALNDLLWFDADWVYEMLGMEVEQ